MKGIILRNLLAIFMFISFSAASLAFSTPAEAQAQRGDVVYATNYGVFYTRGGDPASHVAGEGPLIATTVFEGLIDFGKDLEMLPSIAESWKVAPDWSYIDFFIKKGIQFHNGDPLTAEDVKYSFAKHMDPKMRQVLGPDYRKRIKEIEAVSPFHARFHLHMPAPDTWKRLWWNGAIMPKKYREAIGDIEFADKPIGSGPFRWLEYKQDQYFKMEALPQHHRKAPGFNTLTIVYVPDDATRVAMLKAGEVDITVLAGPHIPVVKNDPELNFIQILHTIGIGILFFDLAHPERESPFHDIRVRKAVSLAIDRETICSKLFFASASPMGDVLCPYNLGFDPTAKPDPYDPERARALLVEAGYARGFETELNSTAGGRLTMEAFAANLAAVGIRTKINVFEGGAWYEAHRGRKLSGIKTFNTWYDAEPHPGADLQNSFNTGAVWAYTDDDTIEKLIDESMAARTDEEAAEYGRKLSRFIREQYIRPPLWSQHGNYGTSKKIVRWEPQAGSYPGTRFEHMVVKP